VGFTGGEKIPSILSFEFMTVENDGKTPLEASGESVGWWPFTKLFKFEFSSNTS
jgi:hypothetical protein